MKQITFSIVLISIIVILTPPLVRPQIIEGIKGNPKDSRSTLVVGVSGARMPPSNDSINDTTWVATWDFDGPQCDESGWERFDNRILNDGSIYWSVRSDYTGIGNIVGDAAVLGSHNLCWRFPDGYDNDWRQAVRIRYTGDQRLLFDYLVDSEDSHDFLLVETDSACSSFDRVDYNVSPHLDAAALRDQVWAVSGFDTTTGRTDTLSLSGYATLDTHCVYLTFFSDWAYAPADGKQPTTLGVGAVIDNVELLGTVGEDFAVFAPRPDFHFVNLQDSRPFGLWARIVHGVPEIDPCTESTCSWVFSDPTLPAFDLSQAYGPGGYVVRNWLDNSIVSPWTSLPSPGALSETLLSLTFFGGQPFSSSRIALNWSVRERKRIADTDSPAPTDSIDCVTAWSAENWTPLSQTEWLTRIWDMTDSITPDAREIQVRFRVADLQGISGYAPPGELNPGPGPYLDRIRIGRWERSTLPEIVTTTHVQDGFASELDLSSPVEDYLPSNDRFGTIDFAASIYHLAGTNGSYSTNTKDSLDVRVDDWSGTGITDVSFHAAIVAGPHVGKAPPPYAVGGEGFFHLSAQEIGNGYWFVDLDDDYFRGGDVLVWFWTATNGAGGFSSLPAGLTSLPTSVEAANEATGGLFEVAYLPSIDWDPGYLQRIAADASGKLEPTAAEIANSKQRSCILYVRQARVPETTVWPRLARRNGPAHRSAFMRTLDQLGYNGRYDVYYLDGMTYVWELAGRASLEQATGYPLIVHDGGRVWRGIQDGTQNGREAVIDQAQWYREWLARGQSSEAGRATLWVLGGRIASASQAMDPFVSDDMGVEVIHEFQSLTPYPSIAAQQDFVWASGDSTDFSGDIAVLDNGTCEATLNNGLEANNTAVVTHRYVLNGTTGDGAVVMKADPVNSTNTILMSFAWSDVLSPGGQPGTAAADLAADILAGTLPDSCQGVPDPTDVARSDDVQQVPQVTQLYQNRPNPFNPVTSIQFDLAEAGHVRLRVYDVTGRLVRTLLDAPMTAGFRHEVLWEGRDDAGRTVASGIYLYRFEAGEVRHSRKLVVLK